MKKLLNEFKNFINQGNVMDLAVAVVMGAAFTAIVTSIVNDLIMPLISMITGGIDFSEMKIVLGEGDTAAAFTYGNFISAVLQFLIIAVVIFLTIKCITAIKNKALIKLNAKEKTVPVCPYCLEEIKSGATRCPHCAGQFDQPI